MRVILHLPKQLFSSSVVGIMYSIVVTAKLFANLGLWSGCLSRIFYEQILILLIFSCWKINNTNNYKYYFQNEKKILEEEKKILINQDI